MDTQLSEQQALTLEPERPGKGSLTLHMRGRLAVETTPRAWREAFALLESEKPRALTLDLAGIDYCDGSGAALILSLVAFALGAPILGWLLAGAVATLQSVLAITGYCLGCRLYFLRWWVPELVTRIWTRGAPRQGGSLVGSKISYR